jgi:tetratricopeptide (TPR) repeat protein
MSLEDLLQELADAERRRDADAQIRIYRQFLSIAQQNSNTVMEIHALRGLGNAYQDKDELHRAHSYRVTAQQLAQDPRSQCPADLRMAIECDLGRSYIEARDWPKAEMHTLRAVELAQSAGKERDRCIFQINLGVIYAATERLEQALQLAEEVRQWGEKREDDYILGLVHGNEAGWLLEQARLNECQRHARQALIHADQRGDVQLRTRMEKLLGECYRLARLATGRREYGTDAERHLQQAVEQARAAQNPSREYEAVTELAKLCEDQGHSDEAAKHCRRGLELLEQVRRGLGYEEFQLTFFESLQPAYDSVTEFFLRHNQLDEAFQTAERLRSRLLLSQLGLERSNTRAWSSDRREELTAIVDEFGRQVVQQCRQGAAGLVRDMTVGLCRKQTGPPANDPSAPQPALSTAESEQPGEQGAPSTDPPPLSGARRRFMSLYEAQRLNRAVWRPQPSPPVARLSEMQRFLGKDEALIVYYLTRRSLVIFVATDDGAHFQHLAYSARDLAADVAAVCGAMGSLQDEVLDGEQWLTRKVEHPWPGPVVQNVARLHRSLEKLYALLFAPILSVTGRKSHWIIVPHGPLHCLPWSALRSSGGYLVQQHCLTLLPSASLGVSLQTRSGPAAESAVLFADPDPEDPALRLPGARREVEAVCRLFPEGPPPLIGAAATKGAFLEHASSAGLLHLACHHFFDASAPLLSFLKLAGGKGSDFLYAFEIAEMTLPAELVVLSACQSGRSQIATGDEQIGIVRAFLAAGVPSVISTLWSIEDQSAAAFFAGFYQNARSMGLAEALATAQRELLADPRFGLPYFWAPYQLTGRWNKPLRCLGSGKTANP